MNKHKNSVRNLNAILTLILSVLPLAACDNIWSDLLLSPSSIVFADGLVVRKTLGSGTYANAISGDGAGELFFSSSDQSIASVNPSTGEVSLLSAGISIITARKSASATHAAVSASYTLIIVLADYVSPIIGTLLYIPAGSFQRDENQENISSLSMFWIGTQEITRAQFQTVLGADPSDTAYSSGNTDPVQSVNWYQAIAFCNKLSLADGLDPVYSVEGIDFSSLSYAAIPRINNSTWNQAGANWANNGYRLPTEMEWMWAAMGADTAKPGAVNTTGYLKAFAGSDGSNAIADFAVYGYHDEYKNDGQTLTERSNPVGSKLANELGIYDMSGNIWEWCWDWHGAYPDGSLSDYRGPSSAALRCIRGGSWAITSTNCSVSFRNNMNPPTMGSLIGLRVVRR